jgi:hypothetical protein
MTEAADALLGALRACWSNLPPGLSPSIRRLDAEPETHSAEDGGTIHVPLRDGGLLLQENDRPDEDAYVTLSDINSDVHLTLPVDLLDRLADVGDVVVVVSRTRRLDVAEKR